MHRTTTTATLLVTVAVSALSGCMTVHRPAAPGPPTAPSGPSARQPEGRSETQAVQAPAREALELIEASRRPEPAASESRPPAPAAPPPERAVPSIGGDHHTRPVRPEPRPRGTHRPRVDVPDVSGTVRRDVRKHVPDNADVCALGRRYGGWPADSPQATICRETYGR